MWPLRGARLRALAASGGVSLNTLRGDASTCTPRPLLQGRLLLAARSGRLQGLHIPDSGVNVTALLMEQVGSTLPLLEAAMAPPCCLLLCALLPGAVWLLLLLAAAGAAAAAAAAAAVAAANDEDTLRAIGCA